MSRRSGGPVGDPQHDSENGQEDRDLPGLAELGDDEVLAECPDDGGGHRGEHDQPGQALLRPIDAPVANGAEPGDESAAMSRRKYAVTATSVPKCRADVEGRVEGVVLLQIRPVCEPGHEDEVAGRRDGQKLGQALDDTEHERLPARQLPCLLADPQGGEHHGQEQRCPGQDVDANARPHGR